MDTPPRINSQIYEEACQWFVDARMGALNATRRRDLDRWMRASPEHMRAYLEIATIWNEGSELGCGPQWDEHRLIAEAVQESSQIIPLPGASPHASESPARPVWKRPRGLIPAGAALVLCVLTMAVWWLAARERAQIFATALGEQRSIELPDHSIVELNSRSRLAGSYSARERNIELLEGEALFKVQKDPWRPFIVSVAGARVRAVGTEFDIYRKRNGTVVSVVEGTVAVAPPVPAEKASKSGAAYLVSSGEQMTLTPVAAHKTNHPDVSAAIAWKQRQMVFDSATLAEVVEEFNRYNPRQLVIGDPDLVSFHISGVFSSTDPLSLVRFLRARAPVRIIETPSLITITGNIS